jgi:hypothetical protein
MQQVMHKTADEIKYQEILSPSVPRNGVAPPLKM